MEKEMKKIVVTGATSMIGSAAAGVRFGASAIIAKNESYAKASPIRGGGIER